MSSVSSAEFDGIRPPRQAIPLKMLFLSLVAGSLLSVAPIGIPGLWDIGIANAQQDDAPPANDQNSDSADDSGVAPADDASNQSPFDNPDIEPLNPGEAVVTRFSQTTDGVDGKGKPIKVIDINGISASILDVRNPPEPPYGQHWIDEPQRMFVTAGEVGQVFGVTIANKDGEAPDIFLSATSAYGLHMIEAGDGKPEWMAGQWGPDAGPGSIYRISAQNGYKAEKFADITLDGRDNTGVALGNIAYDKWHGRLFVSDLETGMIHSLDVETGKQMGRYDHGTMGRANFLDVWSGKQVSLEPVAFDPATSAQIDTCGADFSATPECWNVADFRRRVWGLKVHGDKTGAVRLYYSVWGSDAFGNADWPEAGDDRRNAVWSVAITEDGLFDAKSVRREFFLPAFWPSEPSLGDKAGNSSAVSDITFPECGAQNVMLVAERGGMRNLGLSKPEPFTRPYESRVVRYELGEDNIWRPTGRYDVGFHDLSLKEGDPLLFANAAGGVDFNYRISENGNLDLSKPSQSVWMTGDGLCSPLGGCTDEDKGAGADTSEVHGLQGMPGDAFVPVEAIGKPTPDALLRSYMIDTDLNIDDKGAPIASELARNDATKIGDVATYQVCGAPPLPTIDVPGEDRTEELFPPIEPPVIIPVHTVNMSHAKWASSGHRVRQSWHWREGSWHQADRSWHWREGSWHSANRSWHWRGGSWHDSDRSWHRRNGSWHDRQRSWHMKQRSWDGHQRNRSYHDRARSWGDDHVKGRSQHVRNRSWGRDDNPTHQKGRSVHVKGRSWASDDNPTHSKRRSDAAGKDSPTHLKSRSRSDDNLQHSKRRSDAAKNDGRPTHLKSRSDDNQQHSKRRSDAAQNNDNQDNKPHHLKSRSRADSNVNQHSRQRSNAVQNNNQDQKPRHLRSNSLGDDGTPSRIRRKNSDDLNQQPRHLHKQNNTDDNNDMQLRRNRQKLLLENGE
jgi:hypothetical protein